MLKNVCLLFPVPVLRSLHDPAQYFPANIALGQPFQHGTELHAPLALIMSLMSFMPSPMLPPLAMTFRSAWLMALACSTPITSQASSCLMAIR